MPETKPQAKFFELRQATGFRLKAIRSDGQVYVGVPAKEANYYMLIAGYRRSTSAFLKSGRTYYFNLEVFRKLYPQEHELWDQVEQQAAALMKTNPTPPLWKVRLKRPDQLLTDRPKRLRRKNFLEPIPSGAVLVARPSKFGNPFEIGQDGTREEVLQKFADYLERSPALVAEAKARLKGRDLVCYCRLDLPCHGDVWLKIANS
jgi:hypothetical protein